MARGEPRMKPVRTATVGVTMLITVGLAGCTPSSSGKAAARASATVAGSPPATTAPAEIPPTTPAPSAAPPPSGIPTSGTPTSTAGPPPVSAHAVTAFGAVACPAPEVGGAGSATPLSVAVHIKAVVRCETVQRDYPGLGTWTVQLAEVADTNLGPFLA